MEHTEALQAMQLHAAGTTIRAQQVEDMLKAVRGATMASIVQVTDVKLAAKNKAVIIKKITEASVQLFNNLSEFTSVYTNAVKRSAAKIVGNDTANIEAFEAQSNWFEHTQCYSVVKHKTKEAYYLYAIYNKAKSVYVNADTGLEMSKAEVAAYMTPGAAVELLAGDGRTHNVGQDVEHDVQVRVVGLDNIVSIVAQKQLLIK